MGRIFIIVLYLMFVFAGGLHNAFGLEQGRPATGEIGDFLGELSAVYVQVSKFLIKPVLGWLRHMPDLTADAAEVDEMIFISLEDLANQANRCDREMETMTGIQSVPGYDINGLFIWGATAMILSEVVDIYKDVSQL